MGGEIDLAIIPARMNSRRFPGKNIALFRGKPLVVLAVECARESGVFKEIIVSSEDTRVLCLATNAGASTLLRPEALSAPGVRVPAVCFHALAVRQFKPETFCVLLPTSPLRTPNMLREMAKRFSTKRLYCLISLTAIGLTHDGTAIFCETERFLSELEFYKMTPVYFPIPDEMACDVNTPEDLAEAERRVGERSRIGE